MRNHNVKKTLRSGIRIHETFCGKTEKNFRIRIRIRVETYFK